MILLSLMLLAIIHCHPHPYPHQHKRMLKNGEITRNPNCFYPDPAEIYSWHVHILYNWHDQPSIDAAMELFTDTANHFGLDPKGDCGDLDHNPEMCMFQPDTTPAGPFLTAQWAVFFFNDDLERVTNFISKNRRGHSVVIHPNSDCGTEDHSWWAIWAGQPWPLNLQIFGDIGPAQSANKSFSEVFAAEMTPAKRNEVKSRRKQEILDDPETPELIKQYLREYESSEDIYS